jgi:hypothetical protein
MRLSQTGTFLGTVVGSLTVGLMMTACGSSDSKSMLSESESATTYDYIRIPNADFDNLQWKVAGFNRDHKHSENYVFGYIPQDSIDLPSSFDIIDPLTAITGFDEHTLAPLHPEMLDSKSIGAGYHNYTQLTTMLQDLAQRFPNHISLKTAGKSVDGRELWYVVISDNAAQEEVEPNLLYIANMHGDEVVGREMMLNLINELVTQYGTNEKITSLVNNAQIYIMPSMNPDGFERRQRWNSRSSDLNRDFPDFTSDPNNSTNGREIETQHVMKLFQSKHFVMALNYHGGDICMNLPWDTRANSPLAERFADDALLMKLARDYADASPNMRSNSGGSFERGVTYGYEWYEVDGGMQDYSIVYEQSAHSTVELSHTKWPAATELDGFWAENKQPMIDYLVASINGVHVQVTDASGRPVAVKAKLGSSLRTLSYPNGVIFRPALAGSQNLTIEADGFATQSLTVSSSPFAGELSTVRLISK